MSQQLAYVIITPYSLHKSRTGGILSRLITRTGLDLVGARMFAPSAELVKKYSEAIVSANDPQDRRIQELIYDYILKNLMSDPKTGRKRRLMMLLFKGDDAVRMTRSVIGNISAERRGGETIRDTYGDLIIDENDQLRYFEPAVLASPTADEAEAKLKIWSAPAPVKPSAANGDGAAAKRRTASDSTKVKPASKKAAVRAAGARKTA
jgi:nucleoside diphosphate kinase